MTIADFSGANLWESTAPEPPECPPLDADVSRDAIVVGAGFTGLACALRLAERGASVAILEARGIGHGASGRNVGLVNAGTWMRPDDVVAAMGEPAGNRLLAELGAAPDRVFALVERFGMRCEALRNGTLHLATGPAGLAEIGRRASQWQARGAPVELLDASATCEATGTRAYRGALLDHRAGTIQPLAYARELARAAIGLGAEVYSGSPAVSAARAGAGWRVGTPSGSVTAPLVLVATNAYSGLVPGAPWQVLDEELAIMRYFQVATPPLPAEMRAAILPGGRGAWDTGRVMTSFRMDAGGRLVFGSIGGLGRLSRGTHLAYASRAVARRFPALAGIRFEHVWDGRIGMTGDGLPRLHRLDANVLVLGGYNGRGIAPGTVLGLAAADMLLGDETVSPVPVTEASVRTFRAASTALYAAGSHVAHLFAGRFR